MLLRSLHHWRLIPMIAAGSLLLPASAGAATIQFGTNLDVVTANDHPSTTCAGGTWWYITGNILPSTSTGSCQFTASGFAGGTTFGLAAPANGTATAARIKVGATTGPMRINVVRTLFQQTGNAASPLPSTPFLQAYGPTFTPAANAITTVPLNLPMQAQPTPAVSDTTTVAGTDWLALEILSPSVPVPLVPSAGAVFFAAFPGPTASNVPAPSATPLPNYGQIGYVLAMNADLTTSSAPAPTPTPSVNPSPAPGGAQPPAAGAKVGLARQVAAVAGGRAALELLCEVQDCTGLVTLNRTTGGGKKAAAPAASTTSLGKARFSGKAGQKVKVRVKLNSRGKALLKRSRKAKVQATVALDGGAQPTTLSVTLRR